MTIENLQIMNHFNKKIMPFVLCSCLSLTLVGCSGSSSEETVVNDTQETVETQNNEDVSAAENETNEIVDIYEKSMDADTRVEQSITGTLELANSVANATEEFKATEEYQQSKEQLTEEFDTLVNWLLGNTTIDGYSINDVSDTTIEYAKETVSNLDLIIESYIPEYKEKAKEKLSQLGDFLWDKSTDAGAYIVDKAGQWYEEVKTKSK